MNCGHCLDCKWWDTPHDRLGYGWCQRTKFTNDADIDKPNVLAMCIGYNASGTLLCKADFGCVLYESI